MNLLVGWGERRAECGRGRGRGRGRRGEEGEYERIGKDYQRTQRRQVPGELEKDI